jgi:hypothetical protein
LIATDRVWKPLLIVPILAALAGAGRANETAEVPLRHVSPEGVLAALKGTPGLDGMTMHMKDYSVSLSGTEAGIVEAKSRLALADVLPAQISVKVKVVRYERDADGNVRESTVLNPLLSTLDHVPVSINYSDTASGAQLAGLALTPVLNRDGSVTLDLSVDQPAAAPGTIRRAVVVEKRLRQDTPTRLLGVTLAENKALRHAVENGQVVTDLGPYTATYLDVTVHRLPDESGK